MASKMERWHYFSLITLLLICTLTFCIQMGILYVADVSRFPINTVKIAANFQRITRQEIEGILSTYQTKSYLTLPAAKLRNDLLKLDWADTVEVKKIWPDALSIKLVEKEPIAFWNDVLLTDDGHTVSILAQQDDLMLPRLKGPEIQKEEVLQYYKKLSKLLSNYELHIALIQLYENQSWDLSLTNGILLHLGKQDIEKRLDRFCKAYNLVFANKSANLASVDMRYENGMAVMWRQQKER